ncbi:hypothetical protein BMETH_1731_0 [methanotrophic bacterial endosymbiont of Bathymodiolus sp.]|nr:hypothetical protein BMETH_1731_0 [methanotrophic bacterial endosymbiont of Bathymodiolus sp.]
MIALYSCRAARGEKLLQSLVFEALYHEMILHANLMLCNSKYLRCKIYYFFCNPLFFRVNWRNIKNAVQAEEPMTAKGDT